MQIMDGKEVAASLRKQIASEVEALVAAGKQAAASGGRSGRERRREPDVCRT